MTTAVFRLRSSLCAVSVVIAALLAAPPSRAATLQPVANWGASEVPSDISMSIYVPDAVADNPPILVLVHYCGGNAPAVFGQAQGGGIVAAADRYGFIIVVPSSGRCWDVASNQAWTREGGGDSHAIRQMVTYAIEERGGNADRVYATGDSSGGMMTELLLALYPEIFKAGSALAGMPAGCRGANESSTQRDYSGACAGGSVTHTPEAWGDIVRMMSPGYAGHRPRVQLFHGDGDTIIRYANHTEAIKQWTNVLGLSEEPTTEVGAELGDHQGTRLSWKNGCGFVALDAFTSLGGDHGPSDALFLAEYVVPFLGLDQTGPIDPEVEQCASAGAGGNGGMASMGGTSSGGSAPTSGQGGVGGSAVPGAGTSALGGGAGSGGSPSNAGGSGLDAGGRAGAPQGNAGVTAGGAAGGTLVGAGGGTAGSNLAGGGGLSGGAAGKAGGSPLASAGDGATPDSGCGCELAKVRPSPTSAVGLFLFGLALAGARLRQRRAGLS
jgi:acetylxylan esterase